MKNYNRIMAGRSSCYIDECVVGGYIGADFDIKEDLSENLSLSWEEFNNKYNPIYLANRPDKSKRAAGLACGFLYTICKSLKIDDVILSPDGEGCYYIGIITGDYYYVPDANLPHRRKVNWLDKKIKRNDMSVELQYSIGSIGTCSNATRFADEIESLIGTSTPISIIPKETKSKNSYLERDLHKVFCSYLREESIIAKTIYHEKSSNKADTNQKWVHPDIIGVRFADFKEVTTSKLLRKLDAKQSVCLYSYELKRAIDDDYQLKQCYFQALSNSSWANYGYLVAYEIDDSLLEEIYRLNASFGIGVILLQAKSVDVKILCPAKEKELDYETIDKLCHLNPDFKNFVTELTKVIDAPDQYSGISLNNFISNCDPVFKDDEELEDYCSKNCIPY